MENTKDRIKMLHIPSVIHIVILTVKIGMWLSANLMFETGKALMLCKSVYASLFLAQFSARSCSPALPAPSPCYLAQLRCSMAREAAAWSWAAPSTPAQLNREWQCRRPVPSSNGCTLRVQSFEGLALCVHAHTLATLWCCSRSEALWSTPEPSLMSLSHPSQPSQDGALVLMEGYAGQAERETLEG